MVLHGRAWRSGFSADLSHRRVEGRFIARIKVSVRLSIEAEEAILAFPIESYSLEYRFSEPRLVCFDQGTILTDRLIPRCSGNTSPPLSLGVVQQGSFEVEDGHGADTWLGLPDAPKGTYR